MAEKNERSRTDSGDKSIIDHVAKELFRPEGAPERSEVRRSRTRASKPVEEQVRKEWDPNKKGGLPTFLTSR